MLTAGTTAPDFELNATTPDTKFRLSSMRGKRVIIAFYPADWSPVCTDQLSFLNEVVDMFAAENAVIVAISVDGNWCHKAFSKDRKLDFPLLADFEPKGAVSRLYEAYNEDSGESARALYLIGESGTIDWSYLSPADVNPGIDGILQALEK